MRFVATKTAEQLDLQALHRVRSRLIGERTAVANEIRAFLLDRGIAVAKGLNRLRAELPGILATRTDTLSPRLLHIIEDLIADWRRLDQRIDIVSEEIEALAEADAGCERLTAQLGALRPQALDRRGRQAAAPLRAGDRARQQAGAHRPQGRIHWCETRMLQVHRFLLRRTAGPYTWVTSSMLTGSSGQGM
jgi:transposase